MFRKPLLRAIAGLGLTIIAVGCAPDQLTAPQARAQAVQPAGSLLGGLVGGVVDAVGGVVTIVGNLLVPAVHRTSTLPQDVVVQQTIGSRGGSITVTQAGMRITFAPGAVSEPTTITVTAHAGDYLAYSFEPHGIQFAAPVVISQDMTGIDSQGVSTLLGGYMPDGLSDLNPTSGIVNVSEQYPTVTTFGRRVDGSWGTILTFGIRHFSGYILTGGRQ